jgi:hypothetical protein
MSLQNNLERYHLARNSRVTSLTGRHQCHRSEAKKLKDFRSTRRRFTENLIGQFNGWMIQTRIDAGLWREFRSLTRRSGCAVLD